MCTSILIFEKKMFVSGGNFGGGRGRGGDRGGRGGRGGFRGGRGGGGGFNKGKYMNDVRTLLNK